MGRGYLGQAPIRGHGPHRYVFELFALAKAASQRSRWPNPIRRTVRPPRQARRLASDPPNLCATASAESEQVAGERFRHLAHHRAEIPNATERFCGSTSARDRVATDLYLRAICADHRS
jgi:hypothetical protein